MKGIVATDTITLSTIVLPEVVFGEVTRYDPIIPPHASFRAHPLTLTLSYLGEVTRYDHVYTSFFHAQKRFLLLTWSTPHISLSIHRTPHTPISHCPPHPCLIANLTPVLFSAYLSLSTRNVVKTRRYLPSTWNPPISYYLPPQILLSTSLLSYSLLTSYYQPIM